MVRLRAGTGVRLGGCRQAYGMVALFLPVPVERTALGEPVHLAEIGRIDVPRRRVPPRCARQRHEGVGVDPGPEIRRLPGERERIADVPLILGAGLRAHDDVVVEPAADVLQPPQVPLDVGASHGERVEVLAGAPGPTRCATVSHRGSGRVHREDRRDGAGTYQPQGRYELIRRGTADAIALSRDRARPNR
jgi:hypothetical protein